MSENSKLGNYVGELKTAYDNRPWMYIVLLLVGIFSGNTDRVAEYMNQPHVNQTKIKERVVRLEDTVYNLVEALTIAQEEYDAEEKEPHIKDTKKLPIKGGILDDARDS